MSMPIRYIVVIEYESHDGREVTMDLRYRNIDSRDEVERIVEETITQLELADRVTDIAYNRVEGGVEFES